MQEPASFNGMVELKLTVQEAAALQQLLHRAVLHSGMEVAETAVYLSARIKQAMQREK